MNKIRLSKSSISRLEKDAVCEVLDKEYLGMGEEVMKFEVAIKEYLDTKMDVVCVSTGTAALHLALSALDLENGDEILVPTITYVATFQAITALGLKPIACDVCDDTLFIDVNDAKKRITSKTRVIMPVYYASSSKGIKDVYNLAQEFNLRVVEDAAQGFGCLCDGQKIGTYGDILCFSFDGVKNITSGEGGAVLSCDKNIIERIKDARLLGVEKDSEKRFLGQRSWDFDVKFQGFRYHMSNIMAAIGLSQLSRIDEFIIKRREIARGYIKLLNDIDEIKILNFDFDDIVPYVFVIKVNNRNELRDFLMQNNIETGIHYKPNHLLTKFRTDYSLPTSEKLYNEILTLPCHFDLKFEEVIFVVEKIREFYAK
ncbi:MULTISPECIES: DegT/DnrJ/EryC1/StrS family aminotransferase [unclassified Campylobacter]|uniref:DegT/DnrJ/EryC1/StrS family aminotransferase n=1 Tax=unclassified Campylobacter TaxID=2593542 RepID=UPI003D351792